MNKEKKIWKGLVILGSLLMISIVLLTLWFSRNTSNQTFYGGMNSFEEGWFYSEQGERKDILDIPSVIHMEYKNGFYIQNQLPQLQTGNVLAFENKYQQVEVKIGGNTVYKYESGGKNGFREMLGNTICIVD